MAKKKDVVPVFVDNVEALEAKMQAMREAWNQPGNHQ